MAKNENRRSIYIGEPIKRLLALVGDDDGAFSQTVNGAVARYLEVMREHRPDFSRAEWCAICDALNGTIFDDLWVRRAGKLIAIELEDSRGGLGEKWGVDIPALCAKLMALPTAESLAVLHVVTVFWAHCDLETEAALSLAGIE